MAKILKNESGFTLIIAIISLALMSILGITILSVTTSSFKMIKDDSKSQSAYYIAESGVNHMLNEIKNEVEVNKDLNGEDNESREEFFERIEKVFKNNKSLNNFKENNGHTPIANMEVEIIKKDENNKEYKIISTGKIDNSKRKASSTISIKWNKEEEKKEQNGLSEILFKVGKFVFNGSKINAPGKTIVIGGQDKSSINNGASINAKNIYFKDLSDGVISGKTYGDKTNPGDIYLDGEAKILSSGRNMYGNVHTNGNFTVTGGVDIYGDLIVKGNLTLKGGSNIRGNVYVHGNLILSGGTEILGDVWVLGDIDAGGGAKINGTLKVDDNAELVNVTLMKQASIRGNLTLGYTPTFNDYVDYGGTLEKPKYLDSDKCKKAEVTVIDKNELPSFNFTIPTCEFFLKEKNWYENKGYEIMEGNVTKDIPNSAKWYVDRYENKKWQNDISGEVIIVSKGDIILRGANGFKGALIAPNGIVEYSGGGTFDGVIISKDEMKLLEGGTTFNLKSVEEYFEKENTPVKYKNCSNIDTGTGEDGSNNDEDNLSGRGKIENISGIKELEIK